jgi:hypothetical protein
LALIQHFDPPEHDPINVYLTGEELEQLLDYWVPRLGLQAWKINLKITRAPDLPQDHIQGAATWLASRRAATVHLLDPRDHRTEEPRLWYDMETTLVHELLHVVFAEWTDRSRSDIEGDGTVHSVCVEQPIDQISEALVALRRATETKKNRMGVRS